MRVALLHRGSLSTFMRRDLEALRAAGHEVEDVAYAGFRDGPALARAVRRADAALAWFAEAPAAFAVAAAKRRTPVVAVVGGYEVVNEPSIPYGTFATGDALLRATVRYAVRRADVLLPVSESTRRQTLAVATPRGRVEVLPNGVVIPPLPTRKEPFVLTVGPFSAGSARRKGLDTLAAAARLLPDVRFLAVGGLDDAARALVAPLPPNLELRGAMPHADLMDLFARAKVYAQLSRHESFGVALAEGMAAACAPVAAAAAALPEVVGDTGWLVPPGDAAAAARALREALDAPQAAGMRARERVAARFPLAARAKRLDEILREAVARAR